MSCQTCPTCNGTGAIDLAPVFQVAEFRIDATNARIFRHGVELPGVTAKDLALATLLLHNIGQVVDRERIYKSGWSAGAVLTKSRTIDTHIYRVRRKLRLTPAHGWELLPVYRKGYCLRQLRALKVAA